MGRVEEEGAGRLLHSVRGESRAFVCDPGGGIAGTAEAGVGGTGNRDTETGSDVALDGGVGLLPFVSEGRSNPIENCFGLGAVKPVAGYNEGGEVTALVLAFLEVLALFCFLMNFQGLLWVQEALRGGIEVGDSNVQDTVGGATEKMPHHEVTSFLSWVMFGVGVVGVGPLRAVNPRLPFASILAEGLTVQVAKFIRHEIVTKVHETASLTLHRVVY